jgi:hypothetical protein
MRLKGSVKQWQKLSKSKEKYRMVENLCQLFIG